MSGIEGLLAGRVLADRYHVEKVIGRGGMGAVYRATDQRLGRAVALKVMMLPSGDPESRERVRQRFLREARSAARLRHTNVVTVHDFGTDQALGLDYLVMELMEGEDLAARVGRAGPLSPEEAVEVLAQAARGLAAGHRAGLVHRDVKPGNLFLEEGERGVHVRVLDFGIAQAAMDDTLTHLTMAGRGPLSPAYASPEQLGGAPHLSPASDVFSLGAVGLYVLRGERPFAAAGTDRGDPAAVAVALARLDGVAGLPDGLRATLARAMEPRPEDRFPDANAFREALEALRAGRAEDAVRLAATPFTPVAPDSTPPAVDEEEATRIAAPPPPSGPAPVPLARRRAEVAPRRRRWAVPAVLVVLALLAAALVLNRSRVPRPVDTLAADSAALLDSVRRADSLATADSLRLLAGRIDSLTRARRSDEARRDSAARAESAAAAATLPRTDTTAPPPPGGGEVGLAEVDELPVLRNRDRVQRLLARRYPAVQRRAAISGSVTVSFVVGPRGRVLPASVQIVSASDPAFVEPTRQVVEEMRFDPARKDGRPVPFRVQIPIEWDASS